METIAERNARYCLNKSGVTIVVNGRKQTKCPECSSILGDGDFTGSLPLHDKPATTAIPGIIDISTVKIGDTFRKGKAGKTVWNCVAIGRYGFDHNTDYIKPSDARYGETFVVISRKRLQELRTVRDSNYVNERLLNANFTKIGGE